MRYVSQCAADLCAYLCRLLASDLDGDLLQLVAPQHGAPGQDVSGGVADVIADPRSRATALGGQTSVSCADSLVIAPGEEVICHDGCHIVIAEAGGPAAMALGLLAQYG